MIQFPGWDMSVQWNTNGGGLAELCFANMDNVEPNTQFYARTTNEGDQQSTDVNIGNANSGSFCADVSKDWYQPSPKTIAYNTWTNIVMTSSATNNINFYINGGLWPPSIGSNRGYLPSYANVGNAVFALGDSYIYSMYGGYSSPYTGTAGRVVLGGVQLYALAVNVGSLRSRGTCANSYYFDCNGFRIPSSTSTQLSNEQNYHFLCYTSSSGYQFSCNSGYYFALDSSSGAWRCTACSTSNCGYGYYQSSYCAGATDNSCSACSNGYFCPNDGTQHQCKTATTCGAGYYLSGTCSGTTDYSCSACSTGYFCPNDGTQHQCRVCPAGQYPDQNSPCTQYADTGCSDCGTGYSCPGK